MRKPEMQSILTLFKLFPTPALPRSGSTGMISGIALWDYPRTVNHPGFTYKKFIQQKLNIGKRN
jgi:hypothetical protein